MKKHLFIPELPGGPFANDTTIEQHIPPLLPFGISSKQLLQ